LGDQRRCRHKQHRIAGQDRLAADRHGQVRLADAGRASEILPKNSRSTF
jgi:hypothetical protein